MNISYMQDMVPNAVRNRVPNPLCPQEGVNLTDFSPFTLACY